MRGYIPMTVSDSNYFGNSRDGSLNTTGNVNFSSSTDGATVYRYYGNIRINSGHTVTVNNRCRGLVIYCRGDCIINGTLSMTARGCRGSGMNFAPNNFDNLFRSFGFDDLTTGSVGGAGGSGRHVRGTNRNGYPGQVGINGTCGGGGGGRACSGGSGSRYATSGNGSAGTTWSGGAGGGGADSNRSYTVNGGHGETNGGAGGNGHARSGGIARNAGGGAGNPGGIRSCSGSCGNATHGQSGTGGLLILIVRNILVINGNIQSNGSNGGDGRAGGGSSGGGSITLCYGAKYINNGTVSAAGGSSVSGGGAGGAGSVRVRKILR